MKLVIEFKCVGFDVRVFPWNQGYYVDDTGWDLHEEACEIIKGKFDLIENEYQILEIRDQKLFSQVCEFVNTLGDVNLNSVEIPSSIVHDLDSKTGYTTGDVCLNLDTMIIRGYDVCDYDGWFSALHHPKIQEVQNGIISVDDIEQSKAIIQLATKIAPEHAPYTVAKIRTLK